MCFQLVLNSVISTPQWIRQPKPAWGACCRSAILIPLRLILTQTPSVIESIHGTGASQLIKLWSDLYQLRSKVPYGDRQQFAPPQLFENCMDTYLLVDDEVQSSWIQANSQRAPVGMHRAERPHAVLSREGGPQILGLAQEKAERP